MFDIRREKHLKLKGEELGEWKQKKVIKIKGGKGFNKHGRGDKRGDKVKLNLLWIFLRVAQVAGTELS